MKDEEIKYLLDIFPNHRGRTLRGETLAVYYETERILQQKHVIQKRDCSCQFRSMAENVHTLYDKWKHERQTLSTNTEVS